MAGEYPDVVVGCVGGGSNFAGLAYPFVRRRLREGSETRFVAAEPAACPTLTRGVYAYDFGDTVGMTPLMPMYTLGHDFVPPPVHAGGLRYHGDAPSLCALVKEGIVEAKAIPQTAAFEAAVRFARAEGIIPGPEPAHAIRAAFDEAEAAKQAGEERVILFNLCGHGHFDMSAYDAYLAASSRTSSSPRPTWRPRSSAFRRRPRSGLRGAGLRAGRSAPPPRGTIAPSGWWPSSPGRSERCPSGLRSATGNRVGGSNRLVGSNPTLSAELDSYEISESRVNDAVTA